MLGLGLSPEHKATNLSLGCTNSRPQLHKLCSYHLSDSLHLLEKVVSLFYVSGKSKTLKFQHILFPSETFIWSFWDIECDVKV